jgi:hypothetical protein
MRQLVSALLLSSSFASSVGWAAEEDAEDDKKKSRSADSAEVVREIERGPYVRANVGSTAYIGSRRQILRAGTTLDIAVGGDVVDKEKLSVSVEGTLSQALHNAALTYDNQGILLGQGQIGPQQLIQGDIHTFGLLLGVEASAYPVRRLGIGGHLGGGVTFVPLLMNRDYYATDVVGAAQGDGAWGGPQNQPAVHQGPKPTIYVGPTIEYYTKLSHFSIGLDVDFIYTIGLDLGLKPTGYFKYTF